MGCPRERAALVVFGVVALSGLANAQSSTNGPTFGVYAGLNLATISGKDIPNASNKTGVLVGASLTWQFSDMFGFQPQLEYSQKGVMYSLGNVSVDGRISYVEVPLLFRVSPSGMQGFTPFALIGPAVGYKTECTIKGAVGNLSVSNSCAALSAKVDDIDYGLMFGAGGDFKVGRLKISGTVRYDLGLKNLAPDTDGKNRAISFLVGLHW